MDKYVHVWSSAHSHGCVIYGMPAASEYVIAYSLVHVRYCSQSLRGSEVCLPVHSVHKWQLFGELLIIYYYELLVYLMRSPTCKWGNIKQIWFLVLHILIRNNRVISLGVRGERSDQSQSINDKRDSLFLRGRVSECLDHSVGRALPGKRL